MSLRRKLLLVALLMALLPWGGWQFVRQMETLLREGQVTAQTAATRSVAAAWQELENVQKATSGPVLYARPIEQELTVDGYDDDWEPYLSSAHLYEQDTLKVRVALAESPRWLYLWISVDDDTPVRADPLDPQPARSDHVELVLAADSSLARYRLSSGHSGPVEAIRLDAFAPDSLPLTFSGEWQDRAGGYDLELRLPRPPEAADLGLRVLDFAAGAMFAQARAGTVDDQGEIVPAWLLRYSRTAALRLTRLVQEQQRATVVQGEGWVVARAGQLWGDDREESAGNREWGWLQSLVYRYLLAPEFDSAGEYGVDRARLDTREVTAALGGHAESGWRPAADEYTVVLATAVPLYAGERIAGALVIEQTSDALLIQTNRALLGLGMLSLLTGLVAALVLFVFATRLSLRIRALRNAAESALTPDGRVRRQFPRSDAGDELGDLSRSFAQVFDELAAYTDYQRTLASKLSHELHTPLAIVKSSLENLDHESLPDSARVYAERARDGAERLGGILRAMSEASRMERAIQSAEGEDFDLVAVVRGCVESYRDVAGSRELRLLLPERVVAFHGAPELIAQALDKLFDNALSFTPADGWIEVRLEVLDNAVELRMSNQGPALPERMHGRLFDSLVSLRGGAGGGLHLGLGLYIVRLIAESHLGSAKAENLSNSAGVSFRLHLVGMPRARLA